jgi:hypothetical protein
VLEHIPQPVLQTTFNNTPFRHFQAQKMGPGRVFFDCVVVKGTFRLESGIAPLGREQSPVTLADRYHPGRDAARSSIAEAGDLHLGKPGADVLVTGAAEAPHGKACTRWSCGVTVQEGPRPLLDHRLEATGPRTWQRGPLGGLRLSDPDATLSTPIRYELAYGGHYVRRSDPGTPDRAVVHRANPSGTGFFDPAALDTAHGSEGPRWEVPGSPVTTCNDDSPLAGFGPVARMWAARLRWAGTYDQAWETRVQRDFASGLMPDYPADFDPRFFHAAHPALIAPAPLSPESFVVLRGLVADAPELAFRLTPIRPRAEVLQGARTWRDHPAPLDTLHVDLDRRLVHAVWRIVLDPRLRTSSVILHAEEGAPS